MLKYENMSCRLLDENFFFIYINVCLFLQMLTIFTTFTYIYTITYPILGYKFIAWPLASLSPDFLRNCWAHPLVSWTHVGQKSSGKFPVQHPFSQDAGIIGLPRPSCNKVNDGHDVACRTLTERKLSFLFIHKYSWLEGAWMQTWVPSTPSTIPGRSCLVWMLLPPLGWVDEYNSSATIWGQETLF